MVWSDLSLGEPEPFKSEVNREVGKAVSALTGKTVDFKKPDIIALLDPASGMVDIQVNSLFFYGRYQKFERGIPQTHWNCPGLQGGRLREVQLYWQAVPGLCRGIDRQAGHRTF